MSAGYRQLCTPIVCTTTSWTVYHALTPLVFDLQCCSITPGSTIGIRFHSIGCSYSITTAICLRPPPSELNRCDVHRDNSKRRTFCTDSAEFNMACVTSL